MELDISNNKLDEHAAVILSESLKETKTLVILNINSNEIKAAGATEFADSLMCNASLQVLRMNNNCIGQEGASEIAKAIYVTMEHYQLLRLSLKTRHFGL